MRLIQTLKNRLTAYIRLTRECIAPTKFVSGKEIPVIINNFNRLTTLKQLVESLEKRGYRNIYILDNDSTYPPLLEWYKECGYEVIYLGQNIGFKALWKDKSVRKRFCSDYYIYTDSDVKLSDDCPDDIIDRIFHLLKDKYRLAAKIGLHIRIDNLPDCYANKAKVIEFESKAAVTPNADSLERRPTDTTLAIYRPHTGLCRSRSIEAYRTIRPLSIDHLPWYMDTQNLSDEEKYYIAHTAKPTLWTSKCK